MSRHTIILADHDLDTSSIEALACDVAQRFEVRANYGITALPRQLSRLGIHQPACHDTDDHFMHLGTALDDRARTTYRLVDEFGAQRRLFRTFGEDIFSDADYLGWDDGFALTEIPSLIDAERRDLDQTFYDLLYPDEAISPQTTLWLSIDRHVMYVHDPFAGSWSYMLSHFKQWSARPRCDEVLRDPADLTPMRKELGDLIRRCGGTRLYALDERARNLGRLAQCGSDGRTLTEIEHEIRAAGRAATVDIPQFITDPAYRAAVRDQSERIQAFADDLRDLRDGV